MGAENTRTIRAKLLSLADFPGGYITYVFQNMDTDELYYKYVMCTRFPNWESPLIQIGDQGFLKYKEVEAGKDAWYNPNTGVFTPYKYTDIHFLDFVFEKEPTKEIIV